MENYKAPSKEDLHAYCVLIHYLQQVRSLYEDINNQAEHFINHLKEQQEQLEELQYPLQDLASDLNDNEEDAKRLLKLLVECNAALHQQGGVGSDRNPDREVHNAPHNQ